MPKRNTTTWLDTTHPRACFKQGQRVVQNMGARKSGVVVTSSQLGIKEIENQARRGYPTQPLVPVKWDDGTPDSVPRQFLSLATETS